MADRQIVEAARGTEHIHLFLRHLGVQAEVRLDSREQPVLVMATEKFEQHRRSILTWFVLLNERDGCVYLMERQRGTGQTLL